MNKKNLITEELSKIQKIMYGKSIINENFLGSLTRQAVVNSIRASIESVMDDFVKNAIKLGTKESIEKAAGVIDDITKGGTKAAMSVAATANKVYDDVARSAFNKSYKELSGDLQLTIRNQVRTALGDAEDDVLKSARAAADDLTKGSGKIVGDAKQIADDATKEISRQSTRTGTWNAIKNHFGRNWKKYAAAGVLALIFANFYPGEEPPKEEEDNTILPNPDNTPLPVGDKCMTYKECFGTYTKCCKSDVIAKVQGCLGGLKPDGKFGPKTKAALETAGYPDGFNDSDVDKICGVTPAPVPSPEEDIKFPEADDNIDTLN